MCDESTVNGNPVIIVSVGALDGTENRHELLVKEVEKEGKSANINADLVVGYIQESLRSLWNDGIEEHQDQLRVFLSDAASYMKKAAKIMKTTFAPNLYHVTCVTHALHLAAEALRNEFKDLSQFMSLIKRVMSNSVMRKELFRHSVSSKDSLDFESLSKLSADLISELYDTEDVTESLVTDVLENPFDEKWDQLLTSEASDLWKNIWDQVCTRYIGQPESIKSPKKNMHATTSVQHTAWNLASCSFLLPSLLGGDRKFHPAT
jgi:hypothetical protein